MIAQIFCPLALLGYSRFSNWQAPVGWVDNERGSKICGNLASVKPLVVIAANITRPVGRILLGVGENLGRFLGCLELLILKTFRSLQRG